MAQRSGKRDIKKESREYFLCLQNERRPLRWELIDNIQEVLPDIRDVEVKGSGNGRDAQVYYSLLEGMKYPGRTGRTEFPIPAGTRYVNLTDSQEDR